MDIDYPRLEQDIKASFPPVKLAIGYGSSFFPQKSYDYKAPRQSQLDVVLVVQNTHAFHLDNLRRNPTHYSLFVRAMGVTLGAKFYRKIQNTVIPVVFNPFVTLGEYQLKYGVIAFQDLIEDLSHWEYLTLAG